MLKLTPCPVAATDRADAGFILAIPDAEEIGIFEEDIIEKEIVDEEVRVTRVLLLAAVIETVA